MPECSNVDPHAPDLASSALTRVVIAAFYDTYNELGYGFLERVYLGALAIVLRERGLSVRHEVAMDVVFHGEVIGRYRADLVVNDQLVIEVKAGPVLPAGAKEQLINYLRLSDQDVGLLLHFGPRAEFSRVVSSRRPSDR